jgi:hypothetical protein
MGFEPPSRTIHSITRQRQYDHDYCAPAFSQVNLLLRVVSSTKMRISIHSRRFYFSTADLRKITTKHKAKYKKDSDGLLPIKTTCAKLPYFLVITIAYVMFEKKNQKNPTE